jgi:hypothetical protein
MGLHFLDNPAEFNQARTEGASFNNSHIPCRKVMGLSRRRGDRWPVQPHNPRLAEMSQSK